MTWGGGVISIFSVSAGAEDKEGVPRSYILTLSVSGASGRGGVLHLDAVYVGRHLIHIDGQKLDA